MLSKSKIFLACCLFFIFGVAIHSFNREWSAYQLLWFLGATLFLVATVICWRKFSLRIIFLIILFLFLGLWRYSISIPRMQPCDLGFYNSQQVKIKGTICNEPELDANNQQFSFCGKIITFAGESRIINGKALITTARYPVYHYGDLLIVDGKLQKPEPFQGFAYDEFLAQKQIYSLFFYPKITLISENNLLNHKQKIYSGLLVFKQKFKSIINKGLEEPEASLANAMFLGYKHDIPDRIRTTFSRSGLSHIIAISGLHISILIAIIFEVMLLAGLSRNGSFYFSVLVLFLYIIMIGYPISAVRAGVMGFLVLLALRLKRLPKARNFLIIAAFILLWVNPKLLVSNIGFQLSFLAVAAILFFYPVIKKKLFARIDFIAKNKIISAVIQIILITSIIQLVIAPVIAYNFSQVSFIAPLANLMVLWTLPFVLVAIGIGVIAESLIPAFGAVLFLPAKLLLSYILWIGKVMADLPLAFIQVDVSLAWIIIYYVVLLSAFFGFPYFFYYFVLSYKRFFVKTKTQQQKRYHN